MERMRAHHVAGATYLSVITAGLWQVNVFKVNVSPTATHVLDENFNYNYLTLFYGEDDLGSTRNEIAEKIN
jgi:hypothetical protein